MKSKTIFTHGMIGGGVIGDPPVDTRHGPKTKSFGYQVLGFGSGGEPGAYSVQYLVIAGGASGNNYYGGGGGGAGGMRIISCKTFEVEKGVTYPIQVGDGGPCAPTPGSFPGGVLPERAGEPSIFSTITSSGGGSGGGNSDGLDGGSGGGSAAVNGTPRTAGSGNVPAIPAPLGGPQGNPGGDGGTESGGGGGGHGQPGNDTPGIGVGGTGGNGTASDILVACSPVTYAGGGGGGVYRGGSSGTAAGGSGGGGAGGTCSPRTGVGGTANLGGGGGASGGVAAQGFPTDPGGSGIVILRRLTASSCSTSGTNTTCGSDTIHKFTGDGTFVA